MESDDVTLNPNGAKCLMATEGRQGESRADGFSMALLDPHENFNILLIMQDKPATDISLIWKDTL